MIRPDTFRNNQFCRHLEAIDDALERFATEHGFTVLKNQFRRPERDLRRTGPPMPGADTPHVEFIGLALDEHWLKIDWEEDMLHKVGVAAYYPAPVGKRLYKRVSIVENQPFSIIQVNLNQLLHQALDVLESWPPPVVSEEDPDAALKGWQRTFA